MIRDESKDGSFPKDTPPSLWVNREAHILSFVEAKGFERERFSNCDQMMDYALQRSGPAIGFSKRA